MSALAVHGAAMARVQPRGISLLPRTHGCIPCTLGPEGKTGHGALRYVMFAPAMDRTFFRCGECGERWIRTTGVTCPFVWTRSKVSGASGERRGAWRA